MDQHEQTPQLWTAKDVAAYLQVSRSWVYRQSEAGRLPCLKLGGLLLRFEPSAIRALVIGKQPGVGRTVIPLKNDHKP